MSSALDRLRVDNKQIAENSLATTLEPLIGVTEDGEIIFKPGAKGLSKRVRLLAALLGVIAANRLGLRSAGRLAPREIEELTGIRGNTLRPILKSLSDAGLLRADKGLYSVPPFALHAVIEEIDRG